jgi:hypothetical protein
LKEVLSSISLLHQCDFVRFGVLISFDAWWPGWVMLNFFILEEEQL